MTPWARGGEAGKVGPKFQRNIKIQRVPRLRGLKVSILPNATIVARCSRSEKLSYIYNFLEENEKWVQKSLEDAFEIQAKYPMLSFQEGERLRFLGEYYELVTERSDRRKPEVRLQGARLKVSSSSSLSLVQVKKEVLKFYERAARRFLPKRVGTLAKMTGLIPAKVILRKQKTVWGSCSPSGNIQLNWKLISAPINVIDYVIIHELAHLKHPNHSKYFWAEVEKHCPDYKQHRLWLKRHYFSFDYLNETSELHSSQLPSEVR